MFWKSAHKGKKVWVGLSGGVDSSVSAALLRDAGYEVTGAFIKVWQPDFLPCTWRDDRRDAMRVAARLGIPFVDIDAEEAYKKSVVDYMVASYAAGETPNPDVICNKAVKFGVFAEQAFAQGADFVATGHYARIGYPYGNESTPYLLAGVDPSKDQSYFLWTLSPSILARTIFPVGDMKKTEVRALAERYGLPTAHKKDSQGLCFMGKLDMKEFLARFIPAAPGAVLDERGREIGTHDGAMFFTLGQRHGFRITRQGTLDTPRYVIGKDITANTITVSQAPAASPEAHLRFYLRDGNIRLPQGVSRATYAARIRYRQPLVPCVVRVDGAGGSTELLFDSPELAAPGQSAVVYDGDVCVGGGVIMKQV